jgi:hypothetical protein
MRSLRPWIALALCWSLAFQMLAAAGGGPCRHEASGNPDTQAQTAPDPHAAHRHHQVDPPVQPDQNGCQCGCYCAGVCLHVCHSASVPMTVSIASAPLVDPVFPAVSGSHITGYHLPLYRPPIVS